MRLRRKSYLFTPIINDRLVTLQYVATDDAVDVGQTQVAIHFMDVFQIQGDAFIVADFHLAQGEDIDLEGGAFEVGAAHPSGHAFFLFESDVVDKGGNRLGVEDRTRRTRINQEVGFLTMDGSFHHDMEAFSFDVK